MMPHLGWFLKLIVFCFFNKIAIFSFCHYLIFIFRCIVFGTAGMQISNFIMNTLYIEQRAEKYVYVLVAARTQIKSPDKWVCSFRLKIHCTLYNCLAVHLFLITALHLKYIQMGRSPR